MGLFDSFKRKGDPELERIEREAYEAELKTKKDSSRAAKIEEAKERGKLKARGGHPTLSAIKAGAEKVGKALEKANAIHEKYADSYLSNADRVNTNFNRNMGMMTRGMARGTPTPQKRTKTPERYKRNVPKRAMPKQRASPTDSLRERMNRSLI